jgi:hypothetical protein
MVDAVASDDPQTAPKPGAAGDRGHGGAAAHPAEPGIRAAEQGLAQTGTRCQRAHQYEHRHDRQSVIGKHAPAQRLQLAHHQERAVDDHDADAADEDHRVGDGIRIAISATRMTRPRMPRVTGSIRYLARSCPFREFDEGCETRQHQQRQATRQPA